MQLVCKNEPHYPTHSGLIWSCSIQISIIVPQQVHSQVQSQNHYVFLNTFRFGWLVNKLATNSQQKKPHLTVTKEWKKQYKLLQRLNYKSHAVPQSRTYSGRFPPAHLPGTHVPSSYTPISICHSNPPCSFLMMFVNLPFMVVFTPCVLPQNVCVACLKQQNIQEDESRRCLRDNDKEQIERTTKNAPAQCEAGSSRLLGWKIICIEWSNLKNICPVCAVGFHVEYGLVFKRG